MNGTRYTKVKGISDHRRLPRLGKVRLGIKLKKRGADKRCDHPADEMCMFCSYPKETQHFVVPPEVARAIGTEFPTELDVMLPCDDPEVFFPQAYKFYGKGKGVKCIGNGETATEATDSGFVEKACPCDLLTKRKCNLRAHLMIILPDVNLGGIYQIDIGSYNSIVDINSGVDYVRGLVQVATGRPRIALLKMKLRRVPRITHGSGREETHYTLQLLAPEITLKRLEALRTEPRLIAFDVPPPDDVNPVMDPAGPVIEVEEEPPDEVSGEPGGEGDEDELVEQAIKGIASMDTVPRLTAWWNAASAEGGTLAALTNGNRKRVQQAFDERLAAVRTKQQSAAAPTGQASMV